MIEQENARCTSSFRVCNQTTLLILIAWMSVDSGMARNNSMGLLCALLDSDEPLTFVQNAAPLQTALRKAAQRSADVQADRQLKHLLSRSSFDK